MKQKYPIIFAFLMCLFFFEGRGQQQVFSRENVTTGNWGDGQLPWFYESAGNQGDPDNDNTVANFIRIGHNNNLNMTLNGRNYRAREIVFQPDANNNRTIGGNILDMRHQSGGPSKIENQSIATHTFNNSVAIQDGTAEINPVNGNLVFTNNIFNNGNFIDVFGNNGNKLILSGNLQGVGGITLKQNSTIEIANTMTYTGNTTIEAGVVRIMAGGDLSNDNNVFIGSSGEFDLNNQDITIRSVGEIGSGDGGTINLGSGTLTLSGGFTTRFQNSISGTGGLVKNGTGTITLYGNQSYTGTTTINGGVLATNVNLASSKVEVNDGGTFRVTNGQTVTINDLTLNDGVTLNLEAGSILNVTGEFEETNINITGTGELRVIRTTTQNGNWEIASTWENDRIPSSEYDFIIINHEVSLNSSPSVRFLNISSSGDLSVASNEKLTILNGGRLINDGGFQANESTLEFLGSGSISGSVTLHNLEINGGVNVGSSTTVANDCVIKSGSFFIDNAPRFLENSTLIYDTGGNFSRGIEWNNSTTTNQGTPHNVEIRSSNFQMNGAGFTSGTATIQGDLLITGGSFNMNGFTHSDVEANNIIVDGGNIEMGNTSFGEPIQGRALVANGDFRNLVGSVTLGTGFQGDLKVRGSLFEYLTPSSTFSSQGRAVIFEGDNTINVTSTGEIIIDFVVINMSGGKVTIDNNLTIQGLSGTGGESGILLQMLDQATLDLNGFDLFLGGSDDEEFDVVMEEDTKIISTPSTVITILNDGDTQLRLDESEQGVTNAVRKLIVNNEGKTIISNDLHIFESLEVDEAEVDGNDKLIFRSSENQTAVISEVKNGGSVTGTIRTERYFTMGNRAFRYVSPSVTSTESIRNQWQEGQNNSNTTSNSNTKPGFGTHITGSLNGSNGFDATQSGNPSMFTWNDGTQNWDAVPNTDNTSLEAGKAYALMIRGDRSANLNDNNATGNSTILRSVGVPLFGEQEFTSNVAIGEFVLIGNPYQAQVDLTQVDTSGFTDDFYIWDASMGTFGGYALVEINSGGVVGTITTVPDAGTQANQFLQVNQAFFKKASATPQSITFKETHKHDGINNNTTFSSPEFTRINVNLLRNGDVVVDGLRIDFDESFDDEVNLQDATKLWNLQEYFAIDKNPHWLMVEKRSIPEEESIQFYLDNYFSSEYSLSVNVQNLNTHKAFLYDAYLDESTELTNNQVNIYAFEVDPNIQASKGPHRFSLFFEEISLGVDTLENWDIKVFPNPASEVVHFQVPQNIKGENVQVEIMDLLGKVVLQQNIKIKNEKEQVALPKSIHKGVYLMLISTNNRSYSTKLIVK